jgi:hypothetical protein
MNHARSLLSLFVLAAALGVTPLAQAQSTNRAASLDRQLQLPVAKGHPSPSLELPTLVDGSTMQLQQKWVPGDPIPEGMQSPPEYRYRTGDLLPNGYHLEERPRRGFVIAGFIVAGIPYGIGVMSAVANSFENQTAWLTLPVAGPWLTLASRRRACSEPGDTILDSPECFADRWTDWMIGTSGVIQAIGVTFLIIGHSATASYAVRDDIATWILPGTVGSGYGIVASGSL